MLITYDDEARALYVRSAHASKFRRTATIYNKPEHGILINLDLDKDGKPLGLEIILNGTWAGDPQVDP